MVFVDEYTYVPHDEPLTSPTIVHFNHGLAEIFNALWTAGLTVTLFEEHTSVPWQPLPSGFAWRCLRCNCRMKDQPVRHM